MRDETQLHHLNPDALKVQRDMEILIESFRVITSTLELDDVLKKIMHYAIAIFRSTDAGFIQLFDESSKKLIVKAYAGFDDQIRSIQASIGESIVGKVFRDGSVRLIGTTNEIYDSIELRYTWYSILHISSDISSLRSLALAFLITL